MFCGDCGAKNEVGTKFCGDCGATIESPATPRMPGTATNEKLKADFSIGNIAHFSAPASGPAKLEIGGRILREDIIFKGLAAALVAVLVLLPFLVHGFTIRDYSNQVSRNFFQHIFGSTSTILSIFVLLTPIALFCLYHFKDKIRIDANLRFTAIIALSAFGFIMPFIVRAVIFRPLRATHDNPFVNVTYWISPAIGFTLTLLLYVVVAVIAFGFMQALSKNRA
ncbi:MAG: zinc ribbon domain-containing protein [Oscillospiraceae bacterium]|nr:zinc ribbon domain-containing protein [Oscillospiraceae bacterium]